MSNEGREQSLRAAEQRLQVAQLHSDVAELDALVHERLVFTGPDGRLYGKQDDLDVHGQGRQVMSKVEQQDLRVVQEGQVGITCFLGRLEGSLDGQPFAARMRYTRTWLYDDDRGWQLIAGHASIF